MLWGKKRKEMKILIIPDVHLKPHIIDEAAQCMCSGNYDIAVFLGDFVDDWEQQRNIKAYNDTFDALDEFLRQYPDTLICYGNHDLSYVWEELETGYSAYAHDTVLTRLHEIYKNHGTSRWKIVHKIDDVLFSHAGITVEFLKKNRLSKKSTDEIAAKINEMGKDKLWHDPSPIWARPGNYTFHNACLQVVGHTPVSQPTYYQSQRLLVADNYSTYSTGKAIGTKQMVWVDTKSLEMGVINDTLSEMGGIRITNHILGHPIYQEGQIVIFRTHKGLQKGKIAIVDAYGAAGQKEEPSYDIYAEEDKALYKHIRESEISASQCRKRDQR